MRPQYWEFYSSENANKPQTNNFTNVKDKDLDRWIKDYRTTTDLTKRIRLAHNIQKKVHDLGIVLPLFHIPYFRAGHWRWVEFPKVPATKLSSGLDFFGMSTGGLMWVDEDKKKKTQSARKGKDSFPAITKIDTTFKKKG